MTDDGARPLAVMVALQLVLVAGLVVWGLIGFPLPDAITGTGQQTTSTAQVGASPPTSPVVTGSGSAAAETAAGELAPVATVNRFNGTRAFALLREQVQRYGWRPAGSAALRRLAVALRRELPRGRFEPVPGHPGLRNVVGSLPGTLPAIVVGAHYDV